MKSVDFDKETDFSAHPKNLPQNILLIDVQAILSCKHDCRLMSDASHQNDIEPSEDKQENFLLLSLKYHKLD